MRRYLSENKNSKVSKIIFNIRAETLDIKTWNQWNYDDNLCIMCNVKEENIEHFMECKSYNTEKIMFEKIHSNDGESQFLIGEQAYERHKIRKKQERRGWPGLFPGSHCS